MGADGQLSESERMGAMGGRSGATPVGESVFPSPSSASLVAHSTPITKGPTRLSSTHNPFASALAGLTVNEVKPAARDDEAIEKAGDRAAEKAGDRAAERAASDPMTAVVAEVIDEILLTGDVVTPIDVLVRLEILTHEQCTAWRRGELPYLERGITVGLNKVGRVLRVLELEASARGLTPTVGKYVRSGKGPKRRLRFSKRGDAPSEATYARHFVRAGK